jgi:hypothetical protein
VLVKVEDDKLTFEFTADKAAKGGSGGGADGASDGKVPEYAH